VESEEIFFRFLFNDPREHENILPSACALPFAKSSQKGRCYINVLAGNGGTWEEILHEIGTASLWRAKGLVSLLHPRHSDSTSLLRRLYEQKCSPVWSYHTSE